MNKLIFSLIVFISISIGINAQNEEKTFPQTYIVGQGGDFSTIQEGIDSLTTFGMNDNIVFKIKDGEYNEQLVFSSFIIGSTDFYLRFESESADSASVIIKYYNDVGSEAGVLFMDSVMNIEFNNLTFKALNPNKSKTVQIQGYCQMLTFNNCHFISPGSGIGYENHNIVINDNTNGCPNIEINNSIVEGGDVGMHITENKSESSSNINIEYCKFIKQSTQAISLNFCKGFYITACEIRDVPQGIALDYCDGPGIIDRNRLYESSIYASACLGITNGDEIVFVNNAISLTPFTGEKAGEEKNNESYGMSINNNSEYINVYYNTIHLYGELGSTQALEINDSYNCNLQNNILSNTTEGYVLSVNNEDGILYSDNNVFYGNSTNPFFYAGMSLPSMYDFYSSSGFDESSLDIDPQFISDTNLSITNENVTKAGYDLQNYGYDINGNSRTAPVSIGAYEVDISPLAGYYLIGVNGDYTTINEAIQALYLNGVDEAVTFLIEDGVYNEQVSLNQPIEGAGESYSKIIFQSQSRDSSKVTITNNAANNTNYTILIDSLKYIEFQKLTIKATNQDSCTVVKIDGNTSNCKFLNCRIIGTESTQQGEENKSLVVFTEEGEKYYNEFMFNAFYNGYDALHIDAESEYEGSYNIVGDNIFYYPFNSAIKIRYQNAVSISGNTIKINSNQNGYGIIITECRNDLHVEGNAIHKTQKGFGIYLETYNGDGEMVGVIANNMISMLNGNDNSFSGIYLADADGVLLGHNSILVQSNTSNSKAIQLSSNCLHINISNNLLTNRSNSTAMVLNAIEDAAIDYFDCNSLYSNDNDSVYVFLQSQFLRTIPDIEANMNSSSNCFIHEPLYVNDTNLHTPNDTAIYKKGTDLGEYVYSDFDWEERNIPPTIGADEISEPIFPLKGTYYVGGPNKDFPSIDEACQALVKNSIDSTVILVLHDSTFYEQFYLDFNMHRIGGGGEQIPPMMEKNLNEDTLIIRSASLDSSLCIVDYYALSNNENFVFYINGINNIEVKGITFKASSTDMGRIVKFGNVDNLKFKNCVFYGTEAYSETDVNKILFSGDSLNRCDNITLEQNVFKNGLMAINYIVPVDSNAYNFYVYNNIFENQYLNFLNYKNISLIEIENNTFNTYHNNTYNSTFTGIEIFNGNSLYIKNNNINIHLINGGANGIKITNSISTPGYPSKIANNMMRVSSYGDNVFGYYLINVDSMNIYHNSTYLQSTSSAAAGLYIGTSSQNMNVINNIFSSTYCNALRLDAPALSAFYSNYNVYYSQNILMHYDGQQVSDLAQFNALTNLDTNSMVFAPYFVSDSNLHTTDSRLVGMGANLSAVVSTDIDGDVRDIPPCIGADEFIDVCIKIDTTECNSYTLYAEGNYNSYTWNDGSHDSTLTVNSNGQYWLEVSNGGGLFAADTINITLKNKAQISGVIYTNAAETETLSSGKVYLYEYTVNQVSPKIDSTTVSNGIYQIPAPIGSFIIQVIPDTATYTNLLTTYYGDKFLWDSAAVLSIAYCDSIYENLDIHTIKAEMTEFEYASISGKIFSFTQAKTIGHPLEDVEVTTVQIPPGGPIAHRKTDANGHFQFDSLSTGKRYKLYVDIPGLPMDSVREIVIDSNTSQLNYPYNYYFVDSTHIFVMPDPMITGFVSINNQPVNNGMAYVYNLAYGEELDLQAMDTIDTHGNFSFDSLPIGEYLLYTLPDEHDYTTAVGTYFGNKYFWINADTVVIDSTSKNDGANDNHVEINIVQKPENTTGTGTITGTINWKSFNNDSTNGEALVGAKVMLELNHDSILMVKYTTNTGNYSFDNIPYGTYRILVDIPGLPMDTVRINEISAINDMYVSQYYFVDSSHIYLQNWVITNIDTQENIAQVSVYPNPVNSNLYIKTDNNNDVNIEIYNISGQLMLSEFYANSKNININIDALDNGIYNLIIKTKNNVQTAKIVVY